MNDNDQRAAVEVMAKAISFALEDDYPLSVAEEALRALLDAGWSVSRWQPIEEYKGHNQVWCWHERDRWFRVGRTLPHHGSRWYYTGSTDPEPTHFMILPEPPK